MEKLIGEILHAKEERAEARKKIASQKQVSLSLTLNIPGLPKSNELIHHFFSCSQADLKIFLLSYRIVIKEEEEQERADAAGDFYLVPICDTGISAKAIKEITESFEENHPLGRLLDVDITDENGSPISSGKAKVCYFCNSQAAIYCMRKQTHQYAEMRKRIEFDLNHFLEQKRKERVCKDLAAFALKALLHEVSLSPKPGLVDRFSSGSHSDMDYATFLNSSAVLAVYFKEIAEFGFSFSSSNSIDALPKLRQIGLQMEADMFAETKGVNTHKGAIFLLGFSLFVAAHSIKNKNFSYDSFVDQIKVLNGNLVEKELGKNLYSKGKTHGEECFEKFGAKGKGIRGEIEAGLPCVFKYAIPALNSCFDDTEENISTIQLGLTKALLAIIAHNNDSNILYRKGEQVLDELEYLAQEALSVYESYDFNEKYQALISFCERNRISPGGSADLLAVSYFIYMLNRKYAYNFC